MAHVRQELGLQPGAFERRVARALELDLEALLLADLLAKMASPDLQIGRALRDAPHFADTPLPRGDEDDVFEDHPARMFQPSPGTGDEDAIDRLRPVETSRKVIDGHDQRRGHEHAPVAIERQKRERHEDMEVRLDPASREMNQEYRHEHLADGHRVACRGPARLQERQCDRIGRDDPAKQDRQPDVQMRPALRAGPRPRRDPQCRGDGAEPLDDHQRGEEPIGVAADLQVLFMEDRRRAVDRRFIALREVAAHDDLVVIDPSRQPKTGV